VRIAIVSTYPPRPCGLATFTTDLRHALLEADSSSEVVVASVLDDEPAGRGPEVIVTLRQHERGDYAAAAEALNAAGVDVVLIQHEYGIYGGDSGEYLLDLVDALTVPYVVTLHTMLLEPGPQRARLLRSVCRDAAQVTVFTAMAKDMLVHSGVASWDRVTVLNHGAPAELQRRPADRGPMTPRHRHPGSLDELVPHAGRRVLSTFGLLSPNKGVEVALRALSGVVAEHPDLLYVVAGRTHPEVVRREGERYRQHLEELITDLGLDDHVLFVDRYLSDADIRSLLGRTEVFLTPYRSQDQVVSGVLTFAVVAGCPVVSTPYSYATELLSSGAGCLVGFDDHEAMAAAVHRLLDDDAALRTAADAAHGTGTHYTWPAVGREALKVLGRAAEVHESHGASTPASSSSGAGTAPLRLAQLERLLDGDGVVQHATGLEPDPSTGYCVDDMARLALVADALVVRRPDDVVVTGMAECAVTFLEEAWDPGQGLMRNFRAVDGAWLDDPHAGDHLGRTVWALGEVGTGSTALAQRCRTLLSAIVAAEPPFAFPRSAAYALLGLARLPGPQLGHEGRMLARRLAEDLAARYTRHRSPGWHWFEDVLTYDNARLPQALLAAAARHRDSDQLGQAFEALEWYCQQCDVDADAVALVGNRWRRRGDRRRGAACDEGDEQPLDAAALVEACVEAYRVTGSPVYRKRALDAYAWFHGRNRWGLAVYDEESGGCHDGVGPAGRNANEGAESTLAHLQARLALERVGLTAWEAMG
jgi:glycosyltransferase involved in cell wall biosynthesis